MIGVIVQKDECASDKTLPKELQCRYLRRRAIHIEVEVGDATGMYLWQCFRNRTFDNNCISPLRKVLTYGFDTLDRKSTRLNSSHSQISYAVFCLKKKKQRCTLTLSPAARSRKNTPPSSAVLLVLNQPPHTYSPLTVSTSRAPSNGAVPMTMPPSR